MSEAHDGAAPAASEDMTDADLAAVAVETQEVPATEEELGDEAPAEASEGEGDKPKPKPTAQERFDELTRLRREAEREAEFWKAKATQGQPTEKPAREEPQEDAEPDPAEYTYGETDPAYIKNLARYEGRKAYRDEAEKDRRANAVRTVEQSWNERQQSFAKDKPDYKDVVDNDRWDCSQPMADAIRTSDVGPAVAYHLAKNPDEARRIAALNPLAAIREIGRLEARLDTTSQANPPGKPASDAPTPPPQLRGNGGRFATQPDTTDFAAFEKMADAKG